MRRVTTKNQLLVIGLDDLVDVIMGSIGPVVVGSDMNVQSRSAEIEQAACQKWFDRLGRLERS